MNNHLKSTNYLNKLSCVTLNNALDVETISTPVVIMTIQIRLHVANTSDPLITPKCLRDGTNFQEVSDVLNML